MSGRTAALVAFVAVLVAGQAAVGMRASRTASVTGDEPFYLLTTQSLLSDGDLDLRDEYAGGEADRFWDGSVPLWRQMEPAPDGRLLSPHEPGLSILVAPAYAAGGLRGVQRFLVLVWAAAMGLATLAAARLGAPPPAAAAAGVLAGAGLPGLVYASQVYPEGPAALAVAGLLVLATSGRARPVAAAALLVGLAWLGVKYAAVGAVLALALGWRHRAERRAVAAGAGLCLVAAAHYVWWHLETFGGLTPYGTNVVWAGEGTTAIVADHLRVVGRLHRPVALFVDERFGLLRWSPVLVLAAAGLARRRALAVALVGVAVAVASFASITIMGWWFPGRMLVAVLPAVAVLLAVGLARWPLPGALLGAWSLATAAALAVAARTGAVRLAVDPFDLGAPLAPGWLFPDFRRADAATVAAASAWAAGLILLAWRSSSSSTGTPSPTGPSSPSPPRWRPHRAR